MSCGAGVGVRMAHRGRVRHRGQPPRKESGDRRVVTFKSAGINGMTEGMGAGGHPSLKTHVRMGCELTNLLKPWLSGTDGERRQQP